jgi:AcrR family transcriptional regulator
MGESCNVAETSSGSTAGRARAKRGNPRLHRRAQYEATEHAIVEATYRLLRANASEGTSVNEILREAGLSTRAFYHHFDSKGELLLQLVRDEHERMSAALSAAVAVAATPMDAVAAWVDTFLAAAYTPSRAKRAIVMMSPDAQRAPGYREVTVEGARRHQALLAQVLDDGKRDGAFPHAEPEPDSVAFHSVVIPIIRSRLLGEQAPTRAAARSHTLHLISRALGAPAPQE